MDARDLTRKWIHSHEEDTTETVVYRPAGYAFPPSRGRRAFEIEPGGGAVDYAIGRDDRPDPARGTWSLEADGTLNLAWPGAQGRQSALRIRALAPDKLVVER